MSIKFHVEKTFKLSFDNIFVISGNIIQGEVKKGMRIEIDSILYEINSIEFVNFDNKKALVGLTIIYKDEGQLKQLNDFFSTPKEITIFDNWTSK